MKCDAMQVRLRDTGRYTGKIDGDKPHGYGALTRAAVLLALRDGPDTPATINDMAAAAVRLDIQTAAIRAFWKVEAAGAGFENGYPKILPEPHRFSRNTARAYDVSNPTLSYKVWKTRPYPKTQAARYDMLLDWIGLLAVDGKDVDPAFASASYGAPQILGENFAECGYRDPFEFAIAMARDEITQLRAFMAFVDASGILPHLRRVDGTEESWYPVTSRYNGTAHILNGYPRNIAQAFRLYGGH